MNEKWAWHIAIDDWENGSLSNIFHNLSQKFPDVVELRIDGGYFPDLGTVDRYSGDYGWDCYSLRLNIDTGELGVETVRSTQNVLTDLAKINDFDELNGCLKKYNTDDWLWIDFFIAIRLQILRSDKAEREKGNPWSAEDVWKRFLSQFTKWLI